MKIDEILKAKFKNNQIKAVANLSYTASLISYHQNHFMEKFGLSMPQFNILRILRGSNELLSVNTVKERMVEKSPNTTRLLDKLIDKDLINRIRCESDKRILFVEITQKGLALLSEIDKDIEEKSMFQYHLTDEESNTLSALLDKLRLGIQAK